MKAVSVCIAAALFVMLWLFGSVPRLEDFGSGRAPFAERLMFLLGLEEITNLLRVTRAAARPRPGATGTRIAFKGPTSGAD